MGCELKEWNKWISGIAIVCIVVFSVYEWLRHPLPIHEGKIKIKSLKDSVNVYTDIYGVPHVFAGNEKDLFFFRPDSVADKKETRTKRNPY